MTVEEYIIQCKENLTFLEKQEAYEVCQKLKNYIDIIVNNNVEEFIKSEFDVDCLIEIGFLQIKNPTTEQIEERINHFFGLESIFEFAFMNGGGGTPTLIARNLLSVAKNTKLSDKNCSILN